MVRQRIAKAALRADLLCRRLNDGLLAVAVALAVLAAVLGCYRAAKTYGQAILDSYEVSGTI